MAFSDLRYLLVLGIVTLIVHAIPQGAPRLLSMAFISLVFYVSLNPGTWYVLVAVATLAYFSGLLLSRVPDGRARGMLFATLLTATLLPLLFFKYAATAHHLLPPDGDLAARWSTMANIILPVGISFYSFLAAGYVIDVFVGSLPAERNVIRFGAVMFFFPHLTAGPIERARHLLPQLGNLGVFNYERAVTGLRAILTGLFLKIVVADTLAPYVDAVYSAPRNHGAVDLALATIYFSFQVYADFAGYSLIAIGSARLLGIELTINFMQPWLSQNLPDYWRRWHISLSSWFRDYVFMPLQFQARRWGAYGLAGALVFTFVLVGIWHGAGFNFAVFGLIHGTLVAFSTLTFSRRDRFWRSRVPRPVLLVLRATTTFLIVTLTFILFRASGLREALWIYKALLTGAEGVRTVALTKPLIVITAVIAYDLLVTWAKDAKPFPVWLRWSGYYAGVVCIVAAMIEHVLQASSNVQQFIYFKF